MRSLLTDRRQRVERKLFDANDRIRHARAELDVIDAQLACLREDADEARVRMLVSETAEAHRLFRDAERHAEVLANRRRALGALIEELEATQDELIAKLVV